MVIWDISVEISPTMVRWPGHPPIILEKYRSLSSGDTTNSTRLSLSVHTGTHVDSPNHFFGAGEGVDRIPLSQLIGTVYVADLTHCNFISADVLEEANIPPGVGRILFRTTNSLLWEKDASEFDPNYVSIDSSAAEWLVSRNVVLVGIDYLSIQKFRDASSRAHQILLEKRIVILEGINLQRVSQGQYELVCLPLKLVGADGAPARAVLIER